MFKLSMLFFLLSVTLNAGAIETLVDVPAGTPQGLVVIAPAKKYLMRERLFANLAQKLQAAGYITVRMNWSPATLETPALEIQRASEDIQTAVLNAQSQFGIPPEKTILISKSFSTKALAPSIALARTHVLLTPNCSATEPFASMYEKILHDPDMTLSILISNEDPYCDVHQIHDTLRDLKRLPGLLMTHGDHNFVVPGPTAGESNFSYQDQVIELIALQLRSRP
jgi:hypothetical protein